MGLELYTQPEVRAVLAPTPLPQPGMSCSRWWGWGSLCADISIFPPLQAPEQEQSHPSHELGCSSWAPSPIWGHGMKPRWGCTCLWGQCLGSVRAVLSVHAVLSVRAVPCLSPAAPCLSNSRAAAAPRSPPGLCPAAERRASINKPRAATWGKKKKITTTTTTKIPVRNSVMEAAPREQFRE